MDYRETPPPAPLAGLVKARWTLEAGGADEWLPQQATPDGCIEIIRRTRGRSRWDGDQPASFLVGLVDRPQPFEISGDAAFEALRLWPWAWSLIGDTPLTALHGRWQAIPTPDFQAIEARLSAATELANIGTARAATLVRAPRRNTAARVSAPAALSGRVRNSAR